MLSYLHEFHAGNHADILKHVCLLYVLDYLGKKSKPWCIFDSHSGSGIYNLSSQEALKTGEAEKGILKLLNESGKSDFPEELKPYLSFVKDCLSRKFYPGSPAFEIESALKGKGNAVYLSELHKKEFEKLQSSLALLTENKMDLTVNAVNKSAWDILKSKIPPVIKRGAVLCDPSYEELSDYHNAAQYLSLVHKKWSGATLMLWYPLLSNKIEEIENMKQMIFSTVKNRDIHTEVLDACLCVDKEDSHLETSLENSIGSDKPRLYGSGMFIVNPSWGLYEHLNAILPYLSNILGKDGNGSFTLSYLDKN